MRISKTKGDNDNNSVDSSKVEADNLLVRKTGLNTIVDFWLSDDISDFSKYMPFLKVIEYLGSDDVINMHINCYGGMVDIANQLRNAILKSPASLSVSVEGFCASAATYFFTIADEIKVHSNSIIMFHSYSGCTFGKFHEQVQSMDFYKKWFASFCNDLYKNILEPEEIEMMINGKDLWFTRDEFVPKAKKYIDAKQQEYDKLEALQTEITAAMESVKKQFAKKYSDITGIDSEGISGVNDVVEEEPVTKKPKKKTAKDTEDKPSKKKTSPNKK